jgi:hypothetical protein
MRRVAHLEQPDAVSAKLLPFLREQVGVAVPA